MMVLATSNMSNSQYLLKKRGRNWLFTNVDIIDGVPQDPCPGDSGGPLLHQDPASKRWTIIGTVYGSGYNCETGKTNGPGLWNKVTAHIHWINRVLTSDGGVSCAPRKHWG